MALQIIGAGLGRTGTLSTFMALRTLGFPCYHMYEVLFNRENKHHLKFWRQVANSPPGTQHDWNRIFANYAAVLDNPACCVWRELAAGYPNAKVLLTLHPQGAEAWYESTIETIYLSETRWQFKVLKWFVPSSRRYGDLSKLIWGRTLKGVMGDKVKAVARYNSYIEEVKAALPPERLLVYSVADGWGPLCKFLDVPEPQMPFPRLNSRAQAKHLMRMATNRLCFTVALYAAGAAVGITGLWWALK